MYVCTFVCVRVCVFVCVFACVCLRICCYVHLHTSRCKCKFAYVYLHTYIYIYLYKTTLMMDMRGISLSIACSAHTYQCANTIYTTKTASLCMHKTHACTSSDSHTRALSFSLTHPHHKSTRTQIISIQKTHACTLLLQEQFELSQKYSSRHLLKDVVLLHPVIRGSKTHPF